MKHQLLPLLLLLFGANILSAQLSKTEISKFLSDAKENFGLSEKDINDWIITDQHTSAQSGITHVYLRQRIDAIPIHGANMNIHRLPDGELWTSGSQFVPNAEKQIENDQVYLSAEAAVESAALAMGYSLTTKAKTITADEEENSMTRFIQLEEFSREPIPTQFVYQKTEKGKLRIAYDMAINETNENAWWGIRVDAQTGELLAKDSWTTTCNWGHAHDGASCPAAEIGIPLAPTTLLMDPAYRVLAFPLESPNHGTRTLVSNPEDPNASPFGWHDLDGIPGAEETRAKGNNVQAHLDLNDANDQSGFSPDGGSNLLFDFAFDPADPPADYQPAVVTNLFYWNNLIHDVLYHYGFDEVSGNFQENNYGKGGKDGDSVNADAQDGSGTNNANFSTPRDGRNPRMQMYIWTQANPDRDSDFDNGVIAHEYGHGVSNRLTGGATNVSCLNNREQMGEGWSDYLGLYFTIEAGDAGTDARGIGTYVRNEPISGPGIRPHPYSTDMSINPHTYADIENVSRPHGIGSIWCAMLWEMTWSLIDEYGFDPDIHHGSGGNNMALQLVMEGMKLQTCNPGFVDGRDAILKADEVINNGANQCLIWKAFAKRGLGYGASQGDADVVSDYTESFDLAPDCNLTIDLTGTPSSVPGGNIDYTIVVNNVSGNTLEDVAIANQLPDSTSLIAGSISDGGLLNTDLIEWPLINMLAGESVSRTFSVQVSPTIPLEADFLEDLDNGGASWKTYATNPSRSEWILEDQGGGDFEWFASDPGDHDDQYLYLIPTFKVNAGSQLSFNHFFATEVTWDGGQVHISTDGGTSWTDLGQQMIQNGYNNYINNNPEAHAFSGSNSAYETTVVDLSGFADELINIRFWMHADAAVDSIGWWVDDILLTEVDFTINNQAMATYSGQTIHASMAVPTVLDNISVPLELASFEGTALERTNLLEWRTYSELELASFALFRSKNGRNGWEKIGIREANGNTFETQSYNLVDTQPWSETYYRLESYDFDGTINVSNLIRIFRAESSLSRLSAFPNPFDSELQLNFNLATAGEVEVSVLNLLGNRLDSRNFEANKGMNEESLSLEGLSPGIYWIQIRADGQEKTIRVVRQ